MSDERIKLCPNAFCLGVPKLEKQDGGHRVVCECGWSGPLRPVGSEAVLLWNERDITSEAELSYYKKAVEKAIKTLTGDAPTEQILAELKKNLIGEQ